MIGVDWSLDSRIQGIVMTTGSAALIVRRADSFATRLLGLLARPRLQASEALYLAPCSSVHTIGMRYSIDVAFVDRQGRTIKLVEALKPLRAAWCPVGARSGRVAGRGCASPRHRQGQRFADGSQARGNGMRFACSDVRAGWHRSAPHRKSQAGAGLVESMVGFPLLLMIFLCLMQTGMVFYAKSNVNYASHEAARAATVSHASVASITLAFQKALMPDYGGGRMNAELESSMANNVGADLSNAAMRVEILSPSQESFTDYNSPKLQTALNTSSAVIPNVGLDQLACPRDVPNCQSDPQKNASGQTLLDANVLRLRITYGIPPAKQLPFAGRLFSWALGKLETGSTDAFQKALIDSARIPVVTSTTMRMQSDAIRNDLMVSSPGPGNNGHPTDPGPGSGPGSGTGPARTHLRCPVAPGGTPVA